MCHASRIQTDIPYLYRENIADSGQTNVATIIVNLKERNEKAPAAGVHLITRELERVQSVGLKLRMLRIVS